MHLFVLQQLDLNLTGLNPLLWDSHEGGCLSTPLCVLVFRSHKHTYTHTYIRLQGTQTWQRCLKSESLCSSFHLSMWWVYSWTCLSPVGWSPGPGPDMVWSWCDHGSQALIPVLPGVRTPLEALPALRKTKVMRWARCCWWVTSCCRGYCPI